MVKPTMSAPNDKKRTLEHVKASVLELSIKARKLATEMNAQAAALEGLAYFNEAKLEESTADAEEKDKGGEALVLSAEEEAMMAAAEQQSQPSEGTDTRNGFPLNDDQDNIAFEQLLVDGKLDLQRRDNKQQIVPGKNGRRGDIFENKELFKRTDPRFFFDTNDKVWQRDAPGVNLP